MYNSLLRYPGGKSRAASIIAEHFPYKLPKEVVSPFMGGGSVEFHLASKGVKVYGYDSFHSLVCFWNHVKHHNKELSILCEKYYPLTQIEFKTLQEKLISYEVNRECNIDCAAAFFVLNRASFSGTTLSGGMSPSHPRFNIESIKRIKNFDKRMSNVSIEHMDFAKSLSLHSDKWAYCDPPYYLEKDKANLYGVRGNLHRFFDHEWLCKILRSRDKWLLSYNDCEYIRNLYKEFNIVKLNWSYGMGKEKEGKEILIMPRI